MGTSAVVTRIENALELLERQLDHRPREAPPSRRACSLVLETEGCAARSLPDEARISPPADGVGSSAGGRGNQSTVLPPIARADCPTPAFLGPLRSVMRTC